MYPAKILMVNINDKLADFSTVGFFKFLLNSKSINGSHKKECPRFPYSIQTVINEENAKMSPPKKELAEVNLYSLRRRKVKKPARTG